MPSIAAEQLREAQKIKIDPEAYLDALRDWVQNGERSRYALSPDEVISRSGERDIDGSRAAASFELAQYLQRAGHHRDAARWFREAHRLQPDNWTYKRQAWNFEDPVRQGHTDAYDSSWIEDVKKMGAENYYPAVDL